MRSDWNLKERNEMMYAYPEVLVETDWVKRNLNKPGIRIVEIDVDTKAYAAGHIPGAVAFNRTRTSCETLSHLYAVKP